MIPLPGGTRCYIGFWGAYNATLCASEVASCFFATNMSNPLLEAQNYVSGWFRAIPLPGGTRCEIGFWGAYNAPLCASKVASCFRNELAQSTSLGPKLIFWVVSRDSVARWYPLCDRVLGCKKCTTLCFRSCVLFFRNELAESTSLGPKLSFWVLSRDSVAGRYKLCDWVLGCIKCTTLCFRSCVLFSRNEHAQSTSLGQTKFLGGFVRFSCREVPVVRSGFGVHTMHHFELPKLRLVFSQRTCPIHFFRTKTMFLGGFTRFRCREVPVVRSGFGVHTMHHFVLPTLLLVFTQRTCPYPLL